MIKIWLTEWRYRKLHVRECALLLVLTTITSFSMALLSIQMVDEERWLRGALLFACYMVTFPTALGRWYLDRVVDARRGRQLPEARARRSR